MTENKNRKTSSRTARKGTPIGTLDFAPAGMQLQVATRAADLYRLMVAIAGPPRKVSTEIKKPAKKKQAQPPAPEA